MAVLGAETELVRTFLEQAPMAGTFGIGLFLIGKHMLATSAKQEERRLAQQERFEEQRQKSMDDRHTAYFAQLNEMHNRMLDSEKRSQELHERVLEALAANNELLRGMMDEYAPEEDEQ